MDHVGVGWEALAVIQETDNGRGWRNVDGVKIHFEGRNNRKSLDD